MRRLLFVFSFLALFSCSDDDKADPADKITSITMTINGVEKTFVPTGRGIDLVQEGHKLTLWFENYEEETSLRRNIIIEMQYKKKGHNVMDKFLYSQSLGEGFNADFVQGNFENQVVVNSNKRFKATFSGSAQNGDAIISITDGKVNYVYEEPFE